MCWSHREKDERINWESTLFFGVEQAVKAITKQNHVIVPILHRITYSPTYKVTHLVYNTAITNQKVIDNWIGFSPQCLAVKRYSDLFYWISPSVFRVL